MTGIIEGHKGVKIGGVTVFTYEGAEAAYKRLVARAAEHYTMETSDALGVVSDVMHDLGYTWEQINDMEIEAIRA